MNEACEDSFEEKMKLLIVTALIVLVTGRDSNHVHRYRHQHYERQNARVLEQHRQTRLAREMTMETNSKSPVFAKIPPKFNFVTKAQRSAEFDCKVKKSKHIRYLVEWFRDGKDLRTWGEDKYEKKDFRDKYNWRQKKQVLKITDLHPDDVGNYTCKVTDPASQSSVSRTFVIEQVVEHIAGKPVMAKGQPGNHTVLKGGDLKLSCEVAYIAADDAVYMYWVRHFNNYIEDHKWYDEKGNPLFETLQTCSYIGNCDGYYLESGGVSYN